MYDSDHCEDISYSVTTSEGRVLYNSSLSFTSVAYFIAYGLRADLLSSNCILSSRFVIAGGGAPEIQVALKLSEYAQSLVGMEAYCIRAFAEAMEVRMCMYVRVCLQVIDAAPMAFELLSFL